MTSTSARLYVFDAATGANTGNFDFDCESYYFDIAPSADGKRIYILPINYGPIVVADAQNLSRNCLRSRRRPLPTVSEFHLLSHLSGWHLLLRR